MALIRYPGSKEKLTGAIYSRFPAEMLGAIFLGLKPWEYREPFFGAGAVGFRVLQRISTRCHVWINDIDPAMVSLWEAVRNDREKLIERLNEFEPSVEHFRRFKEEDGRTDLPPGMAGFRKLALHRMSFSGLGAKAGGPIGGKSQNSDYSVGCRWNPETMRKEVLLLTTIMRRQFRSFRITNLDFADLIRDAPRECFIYADPPYYVKGPSLYKYPMSDADHVRPAGLLRETEATWVLSYDDHEFIRDLYSWAQIEPIEIKYTMAITTKQRPKNREIIITPIT
jgi:DNA adenine methylase